LRSQIIYIYKLLSGLIVFRDESHCRRSNASNDPRGRATTPEGAVCVQAGRVWRAGRELALTSAAGRRSDRSERVYVQYTDLQSLRNNVSVYPLMPTVAIRVQL